MAKNFQFEMLRCTLILYFLVLPILSKGYGKCLMITDTFEKGERPFFLKDSIRRKNTVFVDFKSSKLQRLSIAYDRLLPTRMGLFSASVSLLGFPSPLRSFSIHVNYRYGKKKRWESGLGFTYYDGFFDYIYSKAFLEVPPFYQQNRTFIQFPYSKAGLLLIEPLAFRWQPLRPGIFFRVSTLLNFYVLEFDRNFILEAQDYPKVLLRFSSGFTF